MCGLSFVWRRTYCLAKTPSPSRSELRKARAHATLTSVASDIVKPPSIRMASWSPTHGVDLPTVWTYPRCGPTHGVDLPMVWTYPWCGPTHGVDVPMVFTCITFSASASGTSKNGFPTTMPALFTKMSTRPKSHRTQSGNETRALHTLS